VNKDIQYNFIGLSNRRRGSAPFILAWKWQWKVLMPTFRLIFHQILI